jgi:hypothetical protein
MQRIEPNFGGVESLGGRDLNPAAEPAELPPTLQEALQQMLDQPAAHTIGDLAALTDRLTSEMMLFSALVGGSAAKVAAAPVDQCPANTDSADAAQTELHNEFVRELEA